VQKESFIIEEHLKYYVEQIADKNLRLALKYALFSGGKRIRPKMVLAAAQTIEPDVKRAKKFALSSAIAIELVHTYTLIHDDLPSMDNDDYRRGKVSLHNAFDEGLAILAGDALLSDAFAYLAKAKINAANQCELLAKAIGSNGLIAGQVADLKYHKEGKNIDIFNINKLKTANLFAAACSLGGLAVNASKDQLQSLGQFGLNYGMMFQIKDDLVDKEKYIIDKSLIEKYNEQIKKCCELLTYPEHLLQFI
jgi:geranylgeranyl diphosphate synthase, type II